MPNSVSMCKNEARPVFECRDGGGKERPLYSISLALANIYIHTHIYIYYKYILADSILQNASESLGRANSCSGGYDCDMWIRKANKQSRREPALRI